MDNTDTRVVTSTGNRISCRSFIPSFTTVLLICYFIVCLLMNGDITPLTRRGFFCNDVSINKPYHPDTIGIKTLIFIALVLPCVVIKICDQSFDKLFQKFMSQRGQIDLKTRVPRKRRKVSDDIQELEVEEEEKLISSPIKVKRRNLIPSDNCESDIADLELSTKTGENGIDNDHNEVDDDEETTLFTQVPLDTDEEKSDCYNPLTSSKISNENSLRTFTELQLFVFGLCTTMLFTGIGKITCGRLRPHFIQRCQPDVECLATDGTNRYVEEFTCTNSQLRPRDFSYINTSWPSGHASIMFYSMLYMVLYLNNVIPVLVQLSSQKVRRRYDPLVMYTVYILMIGLAGFIAMTRISDYHHHPLDVLSGSILGTITAITFSKILSKQYSHLTPSVIQHL